MGIIERQKGRVREGGEDERERGGGRKTERGEINMEREREIDRNSETNRRTVV